MHSSYTSTNRSHVPSLVLTLENSVTMAGNDGVRQTAILSSKKVGLSSNEKIMEPDTVKACRRPSSPQIDFMRTV